MAKYYVMKSGSESNDGHDPLAAKRVPQQLLGIAKAGDTVFVGPQWTQEHLDYYAKETGAAWEFFIAAPKEPDPGPEPEPVKRSWASKRK